MRNRGMVLLLVPVMSLLVSCSGEPSADEVKQEQVAQACAVVNRWPTDFAVVWGPFVERSRVEGNSPAEAMANYVQLQSLVGGELTNPEALGIIDDYKRYWVMLELDLSSGGGASPTVDSPSTQFGASLLEFCAQFDPELRDITNGN